MVHVGHQRDGRVLVGIRAGDAGDDVAEVVGAPGHANLGQRVPYGGGDTLLVKGHGRLRPQAGQEVQGADVVVVKVGGIQDSYLCQRNRLHTGAVKSGSKSPP